MLPVCTIFIYYYCIYIFHFCVHTQGEFIDKNKAWVREALDTRSYFMQIDFKKLLVKSREGGPLV